MAVKKASTADVMKEQQGSEPAVKPVVLETPMHIDDFLNHIERTEGKRELLNAFAKQQMKAGYVKKLISEWLQELQKFEHEIPH